MEWSESGIILGTRKHGETSLIVELFTRGHGRHLGLVRGGRGRRLRAVLQPGNKVFATWRARLEDHLGQFQVEPERLDAALFMDDQPGLLGLTVIGEQVRLLAEREPHPDLYGRFEDLLAAILKGQDWARQFVKWELALLQELGFGLDLGTCAATGTTDELIYVSPKSGRAVSREAGEPYKERMLFLPAFLHSDDLAVGDDLSNGFKMTDYFLYREVYEPRQIEPSRSRERLVALLIENSAKMA